MAELSNQQNTFCQEYIIDFNATQAAIRSGYSAKTAQAQSSRLLLNVMVQKRIAELIEGRNKRVQVNADYVLARLVEIDQMDVIDIMNDDGSLKVINQWPKVWRQYLSGFEISEIKKLSDGDDEVLSSVLKKIKWPDKVKNLELLGRHTSVGAFKDRHDQQLAELEIDKRQRENRIAASMEGGDTPTPVQVVINVQDARKPDAEPNTECTTGEVPSS